MVKTSCPPSLVQSSIVSVTLVLWRHAAKSGYLKIKICLTKRKYVSSLLDSRWTDGKVIKIQIFNISSTTTVETHIFCTGQNLIFRLSENAACTQRTLSDNSSLGAHDSIEQSKDTSVLRKIAGTNFNPITTGGGGTKCPRRRLFDAVLSVREIQS